MGLLLIFQLFFLTQPPLLIILLIIVLTVIYYYRPFFSGLRNFFIYKSVLNKTETSDKQNDKKVECPKCGQNMQQGYLASSRRIFWSKSNINPSFLPTNTPGSVFPMRLPNMMRGSHLKAYRCNSCRIIYLESNELF